jgi:hypothetical protein
MRRKSLVAVVVAVLVAAGTAAHAEFPFLADPNRCDTSANPPLCIPLPNELSGAAGSCNGNKWKYASTKFCSTDLVVNASPNELFGVTGMSVDTAWRTQTGRSDVLIAVHDSGFMWNDNGAVIDLRKKFHLNCGELPAPRTALNVPVPGSSPGCREPGAEYDLNGDGVFNMPDYDNDASVTNVNGNAVTDPEDLIVLKSNGVDEDGNGYVDDICGWDFFEFDNDPFDEVQYGHGTGEAEDSAAEANNGGAIATCPNCMTLPVRVGDSFVADINSFAQGVVFSVDSGAAVVQEALGTYNQSAIAQQAIDYAYANDVPVMASAADEDSWHHIFPGPYVHTIMVNAIADFGAPDPLPNPPPDSWLYLNGCTNFGANLSVSVSATSCSSEATGRSSGIAGLIVSAGRDAVDAMVLSSPLTANEIRQIITRTADDINFDVPGGPVGTPPSAGLRTVAFADTSRYATQAGFDQFTGYGRINAFTAVNRVLAGDVPPEADVTSPTWFRLLDPDRDGPFTIQGRVAAQRNPAGYNYRVQIAYGVQPIEADFVDVVPWGATLTTPVSGLLATITPAQIPAPTATQIARRLNQLPDLSSDYDEFTYTVRVQVRDADDVSSVGEDRRAIFIHHDADLAAPYPLRIGGDGASSPALADLDGDGASEIVFGTSDGLVYAKRADGSDLPGWPAAGDLLPYNPGSTGFATSALPPPRGAILASVAIGDIDDDSSLDVVAADMEGKVYAWNAAGVRKSGFPVQVNLTYSAHDVRVSPNEHSINRVDRAIIASPALADLDGDGGLDIVVGGNDRHVYVWNGLGVPRAGFPVLVVDQARVSVNPVNHKTTPLFGYCGSTTNCAYRGEKIMNSPALGDIDGDTAIDIVVGTNECYNETPNAALSSGTAAALAELLAQAGQSSCNTRVYAIHKDGTNHAGGPFHTGWPVPIAFMTAEILPNVGEGVNASPALADVDGNGMLEIGVFSAVGPAYLLNADGTSFYGTDPSGYKVMQTEGGSSTSTDMPSIPGLGEGAFGDLTGTGSGPLTFAAPAAGLGRLLAIVLADQQLTADDHLGAWVASTGAYQPTFPQHVEELQFLSGPSIADVGPGPLRTTPEIIEGSAGYYLHAFDASGNEALGWPKFTGGWNVANAAVGDVDGDGLNEVVVLTREGFLYVWNTTAPVGTEEWPKKRHDLRNTGNYEEPVGQTTNPSSTTTTTPTTSSTTSTTVPCAFADTLSLRRARLRLPPGAANDGLNIRGTLTLAPGSDDIDPQAQGFSVSLDALRFNVPPGVFRGASGRWRYRDSSGQTTTPKGITSVAVRRRPDGTYRISVRARGTELSAYDGTTDRTIAVGVTVGNDCATISASFRRIRTDLRYP